MNIIHLAISILLVQIFIDEVLGKAVPGTQEHLFRRQLGSCVFGPHDTCQTACGPEWRGCHNDGYCYNPSEGATCCDNGAICYSDQYCLNDPKYDFGCCGKAQTKEECLAKAKASATPSASPSSSSDDDWSEIHKYVYPAAAAVVVLIIIGVIVCLVMRRRRRARYQAERNASAPAQYYPVREAGYR